MFELKKVYPFPKRFEKIDGHNMHYIEKGEGEEVLLMVHGNPTWSFYYRNLVEHFSKKYRCIAIDHLGCGFSDRTDKDFNLKDRIQHLIEFIDKKNLRNITLIAHDWGGAIGLGALLGRKDLFQKIILMNTAAFNSRDIPARIALCKLPILGRFFNRRLNAFAKAATFMASKSKLSTEVKKGYLVPYGTYRDRKAIDDFVQDIPLNQKHPTYNTLHKIEKELKSIKLPTLLLWGERDFCFHTKFRDRFISEIPHAHVKSFPDAGHYVLEDKFGQCHRTIEEFLGA